jgi:hypothetical protein
VDFSSSRYGIHTYILGGISKVGGLKWCCEVVVYVIGTVLVKSADLRSTGPMCQESNAWKIDTLDQ